MSIGLISNVIHDYQEYREVQNFFTWRAGHPCSLSDKDSIFIETLIDANPSLYLDEIQQIVWYQGSQNPDQWKMSSYFVHRVTYGA